ncbi:CRISPR type III-a/mtube-associated ramp protein csm3 [Myroides odoratimimus CCUG 12700]|uniref:type III-A CRISPR-associated RAMP protein Csm3 n=1 Tax=Myroides odoratimimus TaxID=76832 RepID=UPI0003537314|nr:type III-A CRISPR-associated RAMP protein Csm3 [Myroides odoratimimus]EPH13656.1 CRISPR type III-a/mtube-associated ramp protein csm3 [Myroides odoratimimus CCUG 12700]
MKPLLGKIIIKGELKVLTGLAIGGSKSGIDIGALDNPVIKIKRGNSDVPYIPGSSLKGKLRALLAKAIGSKSVIEDRELMKNEKSEFKHLANVFGYTEGKTVQEALLKVRDGFIKAVHNTEEVTEEKVENTIDRVKGTAIPRPIERVLPETVFEIDLCLDVYDLEEAKEHLQLLDLGLELLQQDYLGGGGTRGNGRVQTNVYVQDYLKINTAKKTLDKSSFDFKFTNSCHNEG